MEQEVAKQMRALNKNTKILTGRWPESFRRGRAGRNTEDGGIGMKWTTETSRHSGVKHILQGSGIQHHYTRFLIWRRRDMHKTKLRTRKDDLPSTKWWVNWAIITRFSKASISHKQLGWSGLWLIPKDLKTPSTSGIPIPKISPIRWSQRHSTSPSSLIKALFKGL